MGRGELLPYNRHLGKRPFRKRDQTSRLTPAGTPSRWRARRDKEPRQHNMGTSAYLCEPQTGTSCASFNPRSSERPAQAAGHSSIGTCCEYLCAQSTCSTPPFKECPAQRSGHSSIGRRYRKGPHALTLEATVDNTHAPVHTHSATRQLGPIQTAIR